MADSRFFKLSGPFKLGELASEFGCNIADKHKDIVIEDVASLENAGNKHICYFEDRKLIAKLKDIKAGACIISEEFKDEVSGDVPVVLSKHPQMTFALIAQKFYPQPKASATHISDKASVHPSAKIGENCVVEDNVIISENVEIGANTIIRANSVIDKGVVIGSECHIWPQVYVGYCIMGNKVVIFPGASIGRDGFGFVMSPSGHVRIPQLGRVMIGNDVHVGANSCIDRGAAGDTVISDGVRIDNLVQIAHNVKLGRGCVIVAQVGIAGSSVLGNFVAAGGQAGIADHINIGDGVQMGAQSGVMRDIPAGEVVMGTPAVPIKQFMRQATYLQKQVSPKKK